MQVNQRAHVDEIIDYSNKKWSRKVPTINIVEFNIFDRSYTQTRYYLLLFIIVYITACHTLIHHGYA